MGKREFKPFMMYRTFARQDFYNTARGFKLAFKERSFDKIGGALITTFVAGAGRIGDSDWKFEVGGKTIKLMGLLGLITALTTSADDPHEMDEGLIKKIFSTLWRSNFGGDIADLVGMFSGHGFRGPNSNILPGLSTGVTQLYDALPLILNAGKVGIHQVAKPDLTFYKSGYLGRHLRSNMTASQGIHIAARDIFATWRGIDNVRVAYTKPYVGVRKTIKNYEKDFRKWYGDIPSTSYPEHIREGHLAAIDYSFEHMVVDENGKVKDPGTITDLCDAIKVAYESSIEVGIRFHNKDMSKAKRDAITSIASKLKSLNPILNGKGIYMDEKDLENIREQSVLYQAELKLFQVKNARMKNKLSSSEYGKWLRENKPMGMTAREIYFNYMEEKAIRQGYNKDEYTATMVKGEKMYNAKVDALLLWWDGYVKENIAKDTENYEHLLSFSPFIAEKLGPEVKESIEMLKEYNKQTLENYKNKSQEELQNFVWTFYPGAGEILKKFKPKYLKPENWKGHWQGHWNRAMFDKIIKDIKSK